MHLKQFYNITAKLSSRKSATTFGDLPDCIVCTQFVRFYAYLMQGIGRFYTYLSGLPHCAHDTIAPVHVATAYTVETLYNTINFY